MTTTWKIFNMKRALSTGLVTEVTCGCIVDHPKAFERELFTIKLTGNPKAPGFIMYEDLDKETVVGWVHSELGSEKVQQVESQLQSRLSNTIYKMNNPTEGQGLPW